jgi:hypothetical protein
MWQFKNAYSSTRLDTQTLSLGTDNRLLISDVQLFDQTGAQLQKNETTYGPLQVYPEGVVATTTFSLAGTGQTVCQ